MEANKDKFYDEQLRNMLISIKDWMDIHEISGENIDKTKKYIEDMSKKFGKDYKKELKKHTDILEFSF